MRAAVARRPGRLTAIIPLAVAVSVALSFVYLRWQPQPLDLSAQTFRADLWDSFGWVVYDTSWYSGHTIPGYSLLYPPLGAWLGPEVLGAICAAVAAALFAAAGVRAYGSRAWLGALWFGVGSTVSLYGGRITFGLGVAFGLAAILSLQRRRPVLGAVAGAAAALASPVAGVFTALAAAAVLLAARLGPVAAPSRAALVRTAWAVGIASLAASAALALAFPTSGFQPFTTDSFLWVPIVCAVCFAVLPVGETTLRCGIVLYALLAILAFDFVTPFGGNAIRFGTLFAGPVMALALYGRRPIVLLLIAAPLLWWQWAATVRDVSAAEGDPATEAAFYQPLTDELKDVAGSEPIRVEIPPTRSRWESVYVGEHFPLARGWLRQLESDDFHLFTGNNLTAPAYGDWLRAHGVDYVAVPDARLDYTGVDEANLVRFTTPGYLTHVWANDVWSLWKVDFPDDTSLRPDTIGPDSFTVTTPGPGRYTIRMRYSPYLDIVEGQGCIEPGDDGTTVLIVPAGVGRQEVAIGASFSLGGLMRREPVCSDADSG